ncbi:MAG: Z1 domain-containing protein [Azospirillaceae bacterium]|nr:Z1 domain-containing protein [Azospirillaceae bacterium]
MQPVDEETRQKVIKVAQELLLDEEDRTAITADLIAEKIDLVVRMNPKWGVGLDLAAVTEELIRRFSIWIGQDTKLTDTVGHVSWLDSSRKRDWRYWQRYRLWLDRKLSDKAVDALDKSTNTVLGLIEDPTREGSWDRRGLVVGHVQSGKTGHYTGLVTKAADAGYKVIIVLAGLHNNLRSQTQMRLDEGFLGYETPIDDHLSIIGAGQFDPDPAIKPNSATNRTNKGDFKRAAANHLAITPEHRPWLFVVKKNKPVLEQLLAWITHHVADSRDPETEKGIVTNLPLLVIDDEADHASVDTGEQVVDENGVPDEKHQPTAINRLIRRILKAFTKSAYVGYTATPFANIFIHDRGVTTEEGPDLFPAAFIINLAAPSSYVGPARVFGLSVDGARNGGLSLVREVDDYGTADAVGGWMPPKHKKEHHPLHNGREELPPSVNEAINAFILACAIRRLRGQAHEHSSMLIHVTRFNLVQRHVHHQVSERLRQVKQRLHRRIGHEGIVAEMKAFWERDFVATSDSIRAIDASLVPGEMLGWQAVSDVLADVVDDIQVRMINGTAKDALDYAEHQGIGLKVIAIGGDKLARGLTLEGLCVSYFLRASKMYDTLMQMGRWFGYRPGYLDVCRLYTSTELVQWFGHIADAAEELREEFDMMEAVGATPMQYGLKVASHPVLMVTSRVKMRSARNLWLSFSGRLIETVAFFRDKAILNANLAAARRLLSALGPGMPNPKRERGGTVNEWQGSLWEGVPVEPVLEFLATYRTHPDAHKVDSHLLTEFIQSMSAAGELTSWTVALIGGGKGGEETLCDGVKVQRLERNDKSSEPDRYSIGRLMSPRDETIDLDEPAWKAALEITRQTWKRDTGRNQDKELPYAPNGPSIRCVRGLGAEGVPAHPERGVLFIYVLESPVDAAGRPLVQCGVAAFAMSFPSSRLEANVKVEYKVNAVLWELEYGGVD